MFTAHSGYTENLDSGCGSGRNFAVASKDYVGPHVSTVTALTFSCGANAKVELTIGDLAVVSVDHERGSSDFSGV